MKWMAWLDTSASDAFAREIGAEFALNYPADRRPRSDKEAAQRLDHATEVVANRAAKFNRSHPMGWYRKARFAKALKAELLERGHDEELADRIVYAVVLRTARPETRARA